ncbi:YadA-like family protein [Gallibacterium melopsittaci]|uniref:YadA-like family protein n=1 Tax=Gallibacterium melopsittaci TaxID=516063 RepID=A0ABV6HVW0_9PAST
MNHIFKVIFDKTRGIFVAVSELTKNHTKEKSELITRHRGGVVRTFTLTNASAGVLAGLGVLSAFVISLEAKAGLDIRAAYNAIASLDCSNRELYGVDLAPTATANSINENTGCPTQYSVTIGYGAISQSSGGTAVGYMSETNGENSTALGRAARAGTVKETSRKNVSIVARQATAVGYNSLAFGNNSVAVGTYVGANLNGIVVGNNTYAQGVSSIAIGGADLVSGISNSEFGDKLPNSTIQSLFAPLWNETTGFFSPSSVNNGVGNSSNGFANLYGGSDDTNERRIKSPTYARGNGAIAIGTRALAGGDVSTALGPLSFALANRSTAVGIRSFVETGAIGGTAIGEQSRVFSSNAVSIGNLTEATNANTVAYGYKAYAVGENSMAIGNQVVAGGSVENGGTFINAYVNGDNAVNMADNDFADVRAAVKNYFIAQENNRLTRRTGDTYLTIGDLDIKKSEEVGKNVIVLGNSSAALKDNSISIGYSSLIDANNSLNIGSYNYIRANSNNSIIFGLNNRIISGAGYENNIAIGLDNIISSAVKDSMTIGRTNYIGQNISDTVVFGSKVSLQNGSNRTFAMGKDVAIGYDTVARDNNKAISNLSGGSGASDVIAFGSYSEVFSGSSNSIALGTRATISNNSPFATAIGSSARASANSAMAIGVGAIASIRNSIALGVNSVTDYTEFALEGWMPNKEDAIYSVSSNSTGIISVGKKGAERRITNVAAGALDTDAVNVSQLKSVYADMIAADFMSNKTQRALHYLSVSNSGASSKLAKELEQQENYNDYVNKKAQYLTYVARKEKNNEAFSQTSLDKMKSYLEQIETSNASFASLASKLSQIQTDGMSQYSDFSAAVAAINAAKTTDSGQKVLTTISENDIAASNYQNNTALAEDSIAIGYKASVKDTATGGIAIGTESQVDLRNSIAIGHTAQVKVGPEGSIALGFGSQTAALNGSQVSDYVITGKTEVAGFNANNPVLSIGNATVNRQIQHVAPGVLSESSTDAVNGSQLYFTNQAIANLESKLSGNSINPPSDGGSSSSSDAASSLQFTDDKDTDSLTVALANQKLKIAGTKDQIETVGKDQTLTIKLAETVTKKLDKIDTNGEESLTALLAKKANLDASNLKDGGTDETNYLTKWRNQLGGITFNGDTGSTKKKLGSTLKIYGASDTETAESGFTKGNIKVIGGENGLFIQLAQNLQGLGDIQINTLKLGTSDNAPTLTADSGNIRVSNGAKITNLTDGTDLSDAATVGQLKLDFVTDSTEAKAGKVNLVKEKLSIKGASGFITTANSKDGQEITIDLAQDLKDKLEKLNTPQGEQGASGIIKGTLGDKGTDADEARKAVAGDAKDGKGGLLAQNTGLNNAATVGDLQTVAKAGLSFADNAGTEVHRPLGTQLNIVGKLNTDKTAGDTTVKADDYASDNLATFADATNNLIRIAMLKNPTFTGVTLDNGNTDDTAAKVTLTPSKATDGDNKGKTVLNLSNGETVGDDGKGDDVVITGVAAGKTNDSVVNLGQLNDLAAKVGTEPVNGIDGKDGKDGIVSTTDGKGVPGTNGNDGKQGPAGKDGLNGTTVVNKVQALRDGVAGTVVYTEADGSRVLAENGSYYKAALVDGMEKANDGLWYAENDVDEDGNVINASAEGKTLKDLATADQNKIVAAKDVILSAVNADGTTNLPSTLANVKSGLGLTGKADNSDAGDDTADKTALTTPEAISADAAQKVIAGDTKNGKGGLLAKAGADLNKAANLGDLQAVAQAGLDFTGSIDASTAGDKGTTVHRPLGTALNIIGAKDTNEGLGGKEAYSAQNLTTLVDAENNQIQIAMKKAPEFESITLKAEGATNGVQVTPNVNGDKLTFANTTTTAGSDTKVVLSGLKDDSTDGTSAVTRAAFDQLASTIGGNGSNGAAGTPGIGGVNGTNGTQGPAGRDGLDGRSLTDQVFAQREGVSGNMVYTNKDGDRLVKIDGGYYKKDAFDGYTLANDGKWYAKEDVNADGSLIENPTSQAKSLTELAAEVAKTDGNKVESKDVVISAVNTNGSTKDAMVLANVDSTLKPADTTADNARKAVAGDNKDGTGGIYSLTDAELKHAASMKDLQTVAQAGLEFAGNNGDAVHRPLGTQLNIVGKLNATETAGDTTVKADDYASDNLATFADATNNLIRIAIKKTPTFEGIVLDGQNGKDGFIGVNENGEVVVINGVDGKNGVDGLDGKDGSKIITAKDLTGENATIKLAYATTDGKGYSKDNSEVKSSTVKLDEGLHFNNGTNTTAEIGENGIVKYNLKSELAGITSIEGETEAGKTAAKITLGKPVATGETPTINVNKARLTDVAAAQDDNDAVNKAQLDALAAKVGVGTKPINGIDGAAGKDGTSKIGDRGVPGTNASNGLQGPAGKDGLNGTTLVNKVQALRDGTAGSSVYTNAETGERVLVENGEYYTINTVDGKVKANDGLWYDKNDVDSKTGEAKSGTTGQTLAQLAGDDETKHLTKDKVAVSAVSPDGTTTNPTTLANIKGNLGDKGLVSDDAAKKAAVDAYNDGKAEADKATSYDDLVAKLTAAETEGDDAAKAAAAKAKADQLVADAKVKLMTTKDSDTAQALATAAREAVAGANKDGKGGLLAQTTGLNNAATVGDLQTVAQAGLSFADNAGTEVHRPLGTQLNIVGKLNAAGTAGDTTVNEDAYASDNLATFADATNNLIRIAIKNTPTFEGIVLDGKGADGKDGYIGVDADGNVVVKNGINGTDGTGGTNGASRVITEADINGTGGVSVNLTYSVNKGNTGTTSLNKGLNFVDGTNTTASIDKDGNIKYDLNDTLTGITSVGGKDGQGKITFGDNNTINVGGARITNVGAPTENSDAANKGYVDTEVANKVTTVTNELTNKGLKFSANGEEGTTVKLGDTVNVNAGANTKVTTTKPKDGVFSYTIEVKGIPMTYVDREGKPLVQVGDDFYHLTANGAVDFTTNVKPAGIKAVKDPSKLNNEAVADDNLATVEVADADLTDSKQAKAAVNAGQVADLIGKDAIKKDSNGNTKVDIGGTGKSSISDAVAQVKADAVKSKTKIAAGDNIEVTDAINSDGSTTYTVKMKNNPEFTELKVGNVKMTSSTDNDGINVLNVGDVQNPTRISGVANGVNPNDAVNVSQLQSLGNHLSNRIENVNRNANAGTASAMATAGLPQPIEAGRSVVAVAGSSYAGENALALGVSKVSDNGKIILKLSGNSNSRGKVGVTAGVAYQW